MAWSDIHTFTATVNAERISVRQNRIYLLGGGDIVELNPTGPTETVVMNVTNMTVHDMVVFQSSLYFAYTLSTATDVVKLARYDGATDTYTDMDTANLDTTMNTVDIFADGSYMVYHTNSTVGATTKNSDYFWRYTSDGSTWADATFDTTEEALLVSPSPGRPGTTGGRYDKKGMYWIMRTTPSADDHLYLFNEGVWEQQKADVALATEDLEAIEGDVFWETQYTNYTRDNDFYRTITPPASIGGVRTTGATLRWTVVIDSSGVIYKFNGFRFKQWEDISPLTNSTSSTAGLCVISGTAYLVVNTGPDYRVYSETYTPMADVTHSQLGIPGSILI